MLVAKRAGMLSARHSAIIRCAKSRQTPTCSISVSTAEVMALELPEANLVRRCTQSAMALTRQYPCGNAPNSALASWLRRSDWQ